MTPMHKHALGWLVVVVALTIGWSGLSMGAEVFGVAVVAWINMFLHQKLLSDHLKRLANEEPSGIVGFFVSVKMLLTIFFVGSLLLVVSTASLVIGWLPPLLGVLTSGVRLARRSKGSVDTLGAS